MSQTCWHHNEPPYTGLSPARIVTNYRLQINIPLSLTSKVFDSSGGIEVTQSYTLNDFGLNIPWTVCLNLLLRRGAKRASLGLSPIL
jgi:hypothetical protein